MHDRTDILHINIFGFRKRCRLSTNPSLLDLVLPSLRGLRPFISVSISSISNLFASFFCHHATVRRSPGLDRQVRHATVLVKISTPWRMDLVVGHGLCPCRIRTLRFVSAVRGSCKQCNASKRGRATRWGGEVARAVGTMQKYKCCCST